MKFLFSASLLTVFLSSYASAFEPKSNTITHYQGHERYEYGAKLLELALNKLETPYEIRVSDTDMVNEARGEREVIMGNLDLQWMSTNRVRESSMIPIKIPIYRGVLGLRLMLVSQDRHTELSHIRDIVDLRKYMGGHGLHWGDLPVYRANNLRVLPHKDYDTIFQLLELDRIDYFHRGINEIWAEQERYQSSLSIADNVMLYYPLPVYFFVTKHRPDLAKQLEKGLNLAIQDGSFKELFETYMGQYVTKGKLDSRSLIVLTNPDLPAGTPGMGVEWWLPSQHLDKIP